MTVLILDENFGSGRLVNALEHRGCSVETLKEVGAKGKPDPEVVKKAARKISEPWVLITMDLSILDDHSGFDWNRYALAWLHVRPDLNGIAVEHSKADTLHRWCHEIRKMNPGDHWSFSFGAKQKQPPSVARFTKRHY